MKKYIKLILLVACLILLISALFTEKHRVLPLAPGNTQIKIIDGLEYTETASVDGLMRKGGDIFDIYSLTPEVLQQKDCPT